MAPAGTRKFRGEKLRELRKARDWSQSKLGRKIGAHVTSISDWERGDNSPSPRHVAGLSEVFEVPMEHFYAEEDEEDSSLPSTAEAAFVAAVDQLVTERVRMALARVGAVA